MGAVPVGRFCVLSVCGNGSWLRRPLSSGGGARSLQRGCGVGRPAERHGGFWGAVGPAATASKAPPHPRRRLRGAETGRCIQSSASSAEKVSQVAGLGSNSPPCRSPTYPSHRGIIFGSVDPHQRPLELSPLGSSQGGLFPQDPILGPQGLLYPACLSTEVPFHGLIPAPLPSASFSVCLLSAFPTLDLLVPGCTPVTLSPTPCPGVSFH